jgi:hypothetical protein
MAERLNVTYNLPPVVEKDIRPQLAYLIGLAPPWVNHLYVDFESNPNEDDRGVRATIKADYKYRKVYVTIYPGFLWENFRCRKESLVHEAAHMLNAPLAEWVTDTLKALSDNSRMEKVLQAGLRQCLEAATEDMATMLIKTAGWGEMLLEDRDPEEIFVAQEGSSVCEERVKPYVPPAEDRPLDQHD